jgi:hypothetical protein
MQVNMQLIDLGIASDFKGCRLDIVGSHSHHVYSAHDLCEPCVHTDGAAAANRRINHPSINNAYVSQRSDIRAR